MMNVLRLPIAAKTKSPLDLFKNFVEQIKQKKELEYKNKVDFLWQQSYSYFLKKYLKTQENKKELDFPDFIYEARIAICTKAKTAADMAIKYAEEKGRKHIDFCYKRQIRKLERLRAINQRKILKNLSK